MDLKVKPVSGQRSDTVKSIEKALNVLLLFSPQERELHHSEIARRMGWTTSTTSRMLNTLVKCNFLIKNAEQGTYMLGNTLYYLGQIADVHVNLKSIGRPVLERISKETQETVHIYLRSGIYRICYAQVESEQEIKQSSVIGGMEPIWEGATGCVLLSYATEEEREAVLRTVQAKKPTLDLQPLRDKMEPTRRAGFAQNHNENHVGCVAAPIYDADGSVSACLGISTPEFRFPDDPSEFTRLVVEGAEEISRQMGYTPARRKQSLPQ